MFILKIILNIMSMKFRQAKSAIQKKKESCKRKKSTKDGLYTRVKNLNSTYSDYNVYKQYTLAEWHH